MKKFLCVLLVLIFILSSCGNEKVSIDMNKFCDEVKGKVEYDDELVLVPDKMVKKYYKLSDGVVGYVVYASGTSATTNELAIFECKDSNSLNAMKEACENRLNDQKGAYENYRPEEIGRINNAIIRTRGNYVLLSVSNSNDIVDKLFAEAK